MTPETDEIEMHEADGVRMYSVVRLDRGAMCDICFQDVPEVAHIHRTEIFSKDGRESRRRWDGLYICQGCVYRIGGMFDPRNAGKELFNGVMQDRPDGVE